MVGIMNSRCILIVMAMLITFAVSGCVSTEELYAQYDAADCKLVATIEPSGSVNLHEQISDTHYPWEPAVYFTFDSSELVAQQSALLDKSMKVMKKFPTLIVGVQGFTDSVGSIDYNRALAQKRVEVVKAYFVSHGIESSRVVLQPIGEVLPPISSDSDTAMAVNRRVELMLLDDNGRPMPVLYAMK